MKYLLIVLSSIVFFASCNPSLSEKELNNYKSNGDSISNSAQAQLLQNLSKAISDSGFAYAISFCNVNAENIIAKTVDNKNVKSIHRLSDKNRNPNNSIETDVDNSIFTSFKTHAKDTVIIQNDNVVYYKPIKIMMPTCLNCHGDEATIYKDVQLAIKDLYPNDKATGYKEGELRGMWKIVMSR